MDRRQIFIVVVMLLILTLSVALALTDVEGSLLAVADLSFRADIYGDTNLEIIQYREDLSFQNRQECTVEMI